MIRSIDVAARGLEQQTQRLEATARRVAGGPATADPVRDAAEQIGARNAFSANVAVIKTADEMVGSLIDVMA